MARERRGRREEKGEGGRAPRESTILAGGAVGRRTDDAKELQVLYLARRKAGRTEVEEEEEDGREEEEGKTTDGTGKKCIPLSLSSSMLHSRLKKLARRTRPTL